MIFAASLLAAAVLAKTTILAPLSCSGCQEIALVWVSGAHYDATSYVDIAKAFQQQASTHNLKAWVGIPSISFDVPMPYFVDGSINASVADLKSAGFTGNEWFLAAHSLGGFLVQDYISNGTKDAAIFKAQVLMGSVLNRDKIEIQSDGTSKLNAYNYPTLTIGGTKDGITRISRVAESYWHQIKNINSAQAHLYPVVMLDGVSHAQFADKTIPSAVQDADLKPNVTLE